NPAMRHGQATALRVTSSCSQHLVSLLHGAVNCLLRQRRHNGVTLRIRVQTVLAQIALQEPLFIHHGRIIIKVCVPVRLCVPFDPARITTTFGCSAMTSGRKRTSICGVVCPLIPRSTYCFPGKKPPYCGLTQASVMESPMNTTRNSNLAGAANAALASEYRAR